jgi:hypothetical protein
MNYLTGKSRTALNDLARTVVLIPDSATGYKVLRADDRAFLGIVVRDVAFRSRWNWYAANGGYGHGYRSRTQAIAALRELAGP